MHPTATRPLTAAAALLTFLLFAAPPAGASRCAGATAIPSDMSEAASATFCLVNAERESRGLAAFKRDADLARAARGHSQDMVRRDYFSHTSPGGQSLKDRLREAGYGRGTGWRAGENIGWGTGARATPAALVDAWLDSPGHRRILLSDDYRELGVGVAAGAPSKDRSLPGATYTMNVGTVRGAG